MKFLNTAFKITIFLFSFIVLIAFLFTLKDGFNSGSAMLVFLFLMCIILLKKDKNKVKNANTSTEINTPKELNESIAANETNENIVTTELFCPHCGVELNKFPQAKTKCKDCNNYIYSRKRPYEDKKVLLKENEIEKVYGDTLRKQDIYEIYKEKKDRFLAKKEELKKQWNIQNISDSDVKWHLYMEDINTAAYSKDWIEYTRLKWEIANFLFDSRRYNVAINYYLEFTYFNMCCPCSTGFLGKEAAEKIGLLIPSFKIIYCASEIGMDINRIKQCFMNINTTFVSLPTSKTEVWDIIYDNILNADFTDKK